MMRKKLTKREKLGVKKWLDLNNFDSIDQCPFDEFYSDSLCDICFSWFPKIDKMWDCPCHKYSFKTVIKRAKEMMEK